MESTEGHITFQKKGRYFTLGNLADGKHLLIALHGYGYLAKYFINKFKELDLDKYVILCPEGLSRFYQSGTEGRVGASWMTKEDRQTDIEDYVNYLDAALDSFKSTCNFP